MHGMLSLPSNQVEKAQNQLIASWKEASEGFSIMFKEEMEQTIRKIKMKLANVISF